MLKVGNFNINEYENYLSTLTDSEIMAEWDLVVNKLRKCCKKVVKTNCSNIITSSGRRI